MTSYPAQTLSDVQASSFVSFLDCARWMAAFVVFLGHLRNPLFLGYGAVPPSDRNLLIQIWYLVTGWHSEAVVVFFVLSGYLVGGLALAKTSLGRFSPADYAVDRATRLFLAFWPALALTAILDAAGTAWFGGTGFYDRSHPMIREKIALGAFEGFATWPIFISNALMLQTVWMPSFGSNQPLWTISLEFWFYAVFGLAMAAWLAGPGRSGLAFGALAALLVLVLGGDFPWYLGLWLIGVLAACVPWRSTELPRLALASFAAVLVLTRLKSDIFEQDFPARMFKYYIVAVAFAWLLVSMRAVRLSPLDRLARYNRFLADFSYSLYLIHFPLMLFLLGALHATGRLDPISRGYSPASAEGLAVYLSVIVAVLLLAWLFSQLTERQTWQVRAALKERLRRRGRPA